jgi:hypothetical protein
MEEGFCFVLASRLEIALLISSFGPGAGWSEGAGAVEMVRVGELGFISESGPVFVDERFLWMRCLRGVWSRVGGSESRVLV